MRKWPVKSLGEICKTASGGTPRRDNNNFYGGGIPWVKSGELKDCIINDIDETISSLGLEKSSAKLFPKGSLLIALYGATVGQLGILGFDAATNQAVCGIFPNNDLINTQFLFYFLFFIRQSLINRSVGGAQPNISQDIVRNIPIPLPPLPEQERIVKLLDEADELRKLRERADKRSAEIIPALFNEMFGDPVENPMGWQKFQVSSFVSELQGGRSVNPAGAEELTGQYRILKISAVTWGDFRYTENKPIPADYFPPDSHIVKAGDLLFSRANTTELVAATSYVFETPKNLLLPDKLWRFVWKLPLKVEPLYIWRLFQTPSIRQELANRATGTGGSMKNISKPKVMTLEVPLPPIDLQRKFAACVSSLRALESAQSSSRKHLDALFQSMLHRAFAGEL